MICRYCGNVIDADATVCPYCGSNLEGYSAAGAYDNGSAYDSASYDSSSYDSSAYESSDGYDEAYEDDGQDYAQPAKKKGGFKLPNLPMSTIISLAAAIFSFICLLTVSSIKSNISQSTTTIMNGLNQLQSNVSSVEERLDGLDSTMSTVQQDAYNQLASQTITITKDVTALTGPVAQGRYNRMFIVDAKGALDLNTSFDWQKYNESTGGWISIVFTGTATSNEEYGLRLENKMSDDDSSVYETILWANGITEAAAGTYRCVITDDNGFTKTSAEATVSIGPAATTE